MAGAADSVYCVPVHDQALLHAPLHRVTALLSAQAAATLAGATAGVPRGTLGVIAARLATEPDDPPGPRTGPLTDPAYLGVIPTRGCTMACGYCDFAAPGLDGASMGLDVAAAAVDAYLVLLEDAGRTQGQVHFFGGEPFTEPAVVDFVVGYARSRAAALGIALHLEATTNGLVSPARAARIAAALDTVVLSLDGPPAIQDAQRPLRRGAPSFEAVVRTARILAAGPAELIIRSCVTAANVDLLPEWAGWLATELHPSTVCFETLTPSARARDHGHMAPDPFRFARNYARASRVLATHGIATTQSTTDLTACRETACPVGRDALIVSPDGSVNACYLLERDWTSRGLDLRLGRIDPETVRFDVSVEALDGVRRFAARDKPLCANCFARFHCAGGCHVHHDTALPPGAYDDLCVVTRLLTADGLLRRLGQPELGLALIDDPASAAALAFHPDDHLGAWEHAGSPSPGAAAS